MQEELIFKNIEQQKIILGLEKIRSGLRMVTNLIKLIENKTIKRVKGIQNYKLSELMKLQHDPKKVIHNFSSYQLSDTEKLLLCKGLTFSIPPKRLKFENYLLPFELLYRNAYDSDKKDKSHFHLKSEIRISVYHHIEFITKKIIVMKTYLRRNMRPLSTSVTTKTLLFKSRQREHSCDN